MLNIFGILISFIGSVVAVSNIVWNKPDPNRGTTWGDLKEKGKKEHQAWIYNIWGLSLIGLGFIFQLISAIREF